MFAKLVLGLPTDAPFAVRTRCWQKFEPDLASAAQTKQFSQMSISLPQPEERQKRSNTKQPRKNLRKVPCDRALQGLQPPARSSLSNKSSGSECQDRLGKSPPCAPGSSGACALGDPDARAAEEQAESKAPSGPLRRCCHPSAVLVISFAFAEH